MANGGAETIRGLWGVIIGLLGVLGMGLWNIAQGTKIRSLEGIVNRFVDKMDRHMEAEEKIFKQMGEDIAVALDRTSKWNGRERRK